jgi:hypothetical protein
MKFHANFKAVTVTKEQWNKEAHNVAKGYIVVDVIFHGDLVTAIYQTQYTILEFNLSRMKRSRLAQLCKYENISLVKQQVSQVPLNKTEILEMMNREIENAKWESDEKYWQVCKKWQFVRGNIDGLMQNNKWRKLVFKESNLPFYKTGYRKGTMNKSQMIQALLWSGDGVYDSYSYYIA